MLRRIGLFHSMGYSVTLLQMTINGVQGGGGGGGGGGLGNMSRGWSFKCLSRGVRGIIEACGLR